MRVNCITRWMARGECSVMKLLISSIIGAFSIWETANIWIVKIPETNFKRKRIENLSKTEIVFDTP